MKLPQDFTFKLRFWVGYVLALLGLFLVVRLAIFGVYYPVFQALSTP